MRKTVLGLAGVLALAVVGGASATGGLPRLGQLQVGPYSVTLYNDSPTLVTGRNVLTLELPGDAADTAHIDFVGPDGRARAVRLQRVSIFGGAADAHGDAMGDMPGMDHGAPAADPHAGHGASPLQLEPVQPWIQATPPVTVRGAVELSPAGIWTVRVSLGGPGGESYSAETVLDATDGSPSRVYLLLTGTVIVAALVVGTIARRRAAHALIGGR